MIYFVESIPGGGKSTYSRYIYNTSVNNPIYYKEEYHNPVDLLRQAVLSKEVYRKLLKDLDNLYEDKCALEAIYNEIDNAITELDNMVFLPYMHIKTNNIKAKQLLFSLYEYEADDGKVALDTYCELILRRLDYFIKNHHAEIDYIFEGALFHNPLISLLGFYDITYDSILSFYQKVYDKLKHSNYTIKLICIDNIEAAIRETAKKRYANNDYCWQQGFEKWFSQTINYKNNNGVDGIINFAIEISKYEEKIIKNVPFRVEIIERRID